MKHLLLTSFFFTLLVVLCTGSLLAQATASMSFSVTIATPIAIQGTADLNFGDVAASAAGTVVMAPNSDRSLTGGITLPYTTGSIGAATFEVTGVDYTYAITLPSGNFTITKIAGVATMNVNSFTSSRSGVGTIRGGSQTVTVGATLHVNDAQLAGIYTNATPFEVTVNYN